jgi:hypothetical protein
VYPVALPELATQRYMPTKICLIRLHLSTSNSLIKYTHITGLQVNIVFFNFKTRY